MDIPATNRRPAPPHLYTPPHGLSNQKSSRTRPAEPAVMDTQGRWRGVSGRGGHAGARLRHAQPAAGCLIGRQPRVSSSGLRAPVCAYRTLRTLSPSVRCFRSGSVRDVKFQVSSRVPWGRFQETRHDQRASGLRSPLASVPETASQASGRAARRKLQLRRLEGDVVRCILSEAAVRRGEHRASLGEGLITAPFSSPPSRL